MTTEKKRYGVGSLEEEIRKIRGLVFQGHDFAPEKPEVIEIEEFEEIEEALGKSIRIKKTKDNMLGGMAKVTMSVAGGKLEFKLAFEGPGSSGKVMKVGVKELARMVA